MVVVENSREGGANAIQKLLDPCVTRSRHSRFLGSVRQFATTRLLYGFWFNPSNGRTVYCIALLMLMRQVADCGKRSCRAAPGRVDHYKYPPFSCHPITRFTTY